MAMNTTGWKCAWPAIATVIACLAFTLSLSAQVQTNTATAMGKDTVVTKVEHGEVVTVSGNDLVVKMADGTLRNFENVPDYARATVDGKQLGIHDLKPGMKLQRTISTTTTPMTITTVQTVKGKVWAINPPLSIILTLENNKNQQFKIPQDQKFNVDGKMVDAWGVRKGMTITATKIVEEPAAVATQEKVVTGEAAPAPVTIPPAPSTAAPMPVTTAPAPVAPAADVPILVAEGNEEAVPAPAEPPAEAPEAAHGLSTTALIGLLCLVGLAAVIGWYLLRKSRSRS
jgi:hypothetical protein